VGEVDLVARRGRRLIAVEVKTGVVPRLCPEIDPLLRPARRYGRESHRRRERAARLLGAAEGARARVDLIEVLVEGPSGRTRLMHHLDVRGPVVELARLKQGRRA